MEAADWPPPWDRKVKRYLQLDGEAEQRAHEVWQQAQRLARPHTWRRIVPMAEFQRLFAPYAGQSRALARLLDGCGQVALMAASLGPGVEERARQLLARREVFAGYLLDRMGSYLVEWRMSSLDRRISEELRARGLAATRRYSPGYQDFSLEAQKVFGSLAAEMSPGITVRPDNSLHPDKSITALMGVGDAEGPAPPQG